MISIHASKVEMCYSARVSLGTFLIGTVGSLLIVSFGHWVDKVVGFFWFFVSSMQFIEYLLWRHPICDDWNRFVSYAGMWLNHLQPLVLGGLFLLYGTRNKRLILYVMLIYAAAMIPFSISFQNVEDQQCTTQHPGSPHLRWNWNNLPYSDPFYILFTGVFVACCFLGFPTQGTRFGFSLLALISSLSSTYLYGRTHAGAMWCFYTALMPPFYVFARQLGWIL